MAEAEPEFAKRFGGAFATLAAKRKLANTLVLFAHPDMAEWMRHFFSRLDFTQFTQTSQPFDVITYGVGESGVDYGGMHPSLILAGELVNIESR